MKGKWIIGLVLAGVFVVVAEKWFRRPSTSSGGPVGSGHPGTAPSSVDLWRWDFPETNEAGVYSLENLAQSNVVRQARAEAELAGRKKELTNAFSNLSDKARAMVEPLYSEENKKRLIEMRHQIEQQAKEGGRRLVEELPRIVGRNQTQQSVTSVKDRTTVALGWSIDSISMAVASADVEHIARAVLREKQWALDMYLDQLRGAAGLGQVGETKLSRLRQARAELLELELAHVIAPETIKAVPLDTNRLDLTENTLRRAQEGLSRVALTNAIISNFFTADRFDEMQQSTVLREGQLAVRIKREEVGRLEAELAALLREQSGKQPSQDETRPDYPSSNGRNRSSSSRRSPDPAAVDLNSIRSALPDKAVLVEYVKFKADMAERVGFLKTQTNTSPMSFHYGAVVVAKNSLDWVPLAEAGELEGCVRDCQRILSLGCRSEEEAASVLRRVYELVWLPIRRRLPPNAETVFVSADGAVERVSIASLWTGHGFVAEELAICHLPSARALLRRDRGPRRDSSNRVVILADPDFGQRANLRSSIKSDSPAWKKELADCGWLRLKGTVEESRSISNLAAGAGLAVSIYQGQGASEAAFNGLAAPRFLHLATHGQWVSTNFSVPSAPVSPTVAAMRQWNTNRPWVSPEKSLASDFLGTGRDTQWMLQSWILLAGANQTISQWYDGKLPPLGNDGILTAGELALTPLEGTELIALSGCESGLGEDAVTEGVFGFRRAAAIAGAQNVLLSLWPIHDKATMEFMTAFYKEAFSGVDLPQALRKVQVAQLREAMERVVLENQGKTAGIFEAIRMAGPFVLSSIVVSRN